MTAEHQRLTERCLLAEDQFRDLQQQQQQQNVADLARIERQLVGELTVCVADLQSLVDVCTQCANNEEPNLAALLGVRRKYDDCVHESMCMGHRVYYLKLGED